MSGLFKKKKVETTSKVDPYAGLPDWARKYYETDAERSTKLLNTAESTRNWLAANPQKFADMSPQEQEALRSMKGASSKSMGLLDEARGVLGSDTYGSAADDAEFNQAIRGYSTNSGGIDAYGDDPAVLASLKGYDPNDPRVMEALRGYDPNDPSTLGAIRGYDTSNPDVLKALDGDRYRSSYTDNVVDTTLAGMDRNAARDRQARGASESAIGGINSTRASVADALSGQLFGMDRAQTEAKLRDDAERYAGTMGQGEAQLRDEMAQFAAQYGLSEAQFRDQMKQFGAQYGLSEAELFDQMNQFDTQAGLDEASFRDGRDRFGSEFSLDTSRFADDKNRFAANYGLDEAAARDSRRRFKSDLTYRKADALSGLATTGMDVASTAANYQGAYGAMERDIQDKRLAASRNAPADAQSWYTDIFNSTRQLPTTGSQMQTNTQPGKSPFQQILGAASTAAGIWSQLSDERAKEDIEPEAGALDKLRDVETFSYRYRDGLGLPRDITTGLMAQDLERAGIVGAVVERPDGLKEVQPYAVLATVVQAVRELDARTRAQVGLSEVA